MTSKAIIDNAKMTWTRWWYDSNISFIETNFVYYQRAIDAIAIIKPRFKGLTY